jgi:heat-inducible transcriptional repressor
MQLDQRKRTVLQGVVWSYVETAEPVGSDNLAQRYSWWGVKSATIRNTLADLADLGYLTQPHTSAGRIPSDRGYRFYVDHLVEFGMADMQAAENAKGALHQERAETLERILKQTCALLTQLITPVSPLALGPQIRAFAKSSPLPWETALSFLWRS